MVKRRIEDGITWLFGSEGDIGTDSRVQVVLASAAVASSGGFLVSPILSDLAGPYGVSDVQVGALMTAFTAPPIVLVPLAGLLADRYGRRPVLAFGLLLFGLAGVGVGATTSFRVALALRALQGVGYAAIMPLTVAILGDFYEGERESTAQGFRVAGIHVVSSTGPFLAGVLVVASWRYPFLLFAGAIPITWWAWTTLPAVDRSERRTVRAYVRDLVSMFRWSQMLLVVLSFAVRFALVFGFLTYISLLAVREAGVSNVVAGALVSSWGLVALASSTQTGRVTASFDHLTVMIWGFLLAGVSVVLMGLYPDPWALFVSVPLLGLASGITSPTQKSLVNRLAPREVRAGAVSSAIIFQNVGRAAGPAMTGLLIGAFGIDLGFVILGVSTGGVGCLMFVALRLLN